MFNLYTGKKVVELRRIDMSAIKAIEHIKRRVKVTSLRRTISRTRYSHFLKKKD